LTRTAFTSIYCQKVSVAGLVVVFAELSSRILVSIQLPSACHHSFWSDVRTRAEFFIISFIPLSVGSNHNRYGDFRYFRLSSRGARQLSAQFRWQIGKKSQKLLCQVNSCGSCRHVDSKLTERPHHYSSHVLEIAQYDDALGHRLLRVHRGRNE
jgi:hypothetical protein